MQDKVFQCAVGIVGLSKAVSLRCAVDHTMLHFFIHTVMNEKKNNHINECHTITSMRNITLKAFSRYCFSKMIYLHNRAGVASLFAALADQERSRSFTLKHLLSLRPAQFSNKPICLILMRQILLVSLQHICAEKTKSRTVTPP